MDLNLEEQHIIDILDELERKELDSLSDVESPQIPATEDSDISDVDEQDLQQNVEGDSASEQSESEEVTANNMDLPHYIGRDGETAWSYVPVRKSTQTRACNIVTNLPGPVRGAKNVKSEIDCFKIFFPNELLEKIVEFTNIKIRSVQQNYSRDRDARETDFDEICAYMGLLYLSGVCMSNKQNLLDLWRKDGLGVEIFRLVMGVNRFRFLQQMLRFDDTGDVNRPQRKEEDKLFCIREIFESFVENCKSNYSHSAYVTVDELLPNFRGRCSFRVFMTQKPGKYGIKVWATSDAKTYYISFLEIFVGNQPPGQYKLNNTVTAVVQRAVSHLQNSGRNITCDNFFTSVPLAESLLQKKLTLVGTMKKNKKEVPPLFVAKDKTRPAPSAMFGFSTTSTLYSFKPKPKKVVLLLSTLHDDDAMDDSTDGVKPEMVTFYNKTKIGVDTSDALQKRYSVSRIATRWPLAVFFFLLNIGGINSYIIFRHNNQAKTKRKDFLYSLGRDLVENHCKRQLYDSNIGNTMKTRISEIFSFPRKRQTEDKERCTNHEERCHYCPPKKNRKTKTRCATCVKAICKEHTTTTCKQCNENNEEDE